MIVGDLFSGIGGFSLAAEWMGWRTAFFSEIDPYASAVLKQHWPDVPNLGDITAVDWTTAPRIDVLTGGFPCQPHSLAGKRLASSDERDLFSEVIRAVRGLRPGVVVLENVRGLLTSESGRFFGRVLRELAGCGYDVEWRVLSAAAVGAPHKRDRIWITAYANSGRVCRVESNAGDGAAVSTEEPQRLVHRGDGGSVVPDTISTRGARLESARRARALRPWRLRGAEDLQRLAADPFRAGPRWPQPLLRRMDDGLHARVDRLRAVGNSIVPQCAYEIFQAVQSRMTPAEARAR